MGGRRMGGRRGGIEMGLWGRGRWRGMGCERRGADRCTGVVNMVVIL